MNNTTHFPYRFFIITFCWSWTIWTPLVLGSLKIIPISNTLLSILPIPVTMIAVFGPLVGALFVLHLEQGKGSSIKYLKRFLDIHLGWKAYIFPVLIFGGTTFIAWLLPEAFGEKRLSMIFPSSWLFIPYIFLMIFLGGGQEELGWRGYALPLLERKFGIWLGNSILGIIWACWHLPLWFITGMAQTYMNFGGFMLLMVGYSFILSWVLKISGNRPLSALYTHGFANAFIPLMPTLIMHKNMPQPRFWIWVILTFLVGILITFFRDKIYVTKFNQAL